MKIMEIKRHFSILIKVKNFIIKKANTQFFNAN